MATEKFVVKKTTRPYPVEAPDYVYVSYLVNDQTHAYGDQFLQAQEFDTKPDAKTYIDNNIANYPNSKFEILEVLV